MDLKTELRWLVKDSTRVLQYRNLVNGTDYSSIDPKTNSFVQTKIWTNWIDVPEFKMNGDGNDNA